MTFTLPPLLTSLGVLFLAAVCGVGGWLIGAFAAVATMDSGPEWMGCLIYLLPVVGVVGGFWWGVALL